MDRDALRKRLGERFEALKSERAPWESGWQEASKLINPYRGRFGTDVTQRTFSEKVLDNEATLALDILVAGLTSGLAGPSRPWFRLSLQDIELSSSGPVRLWLDDAEEVMQWIFARTNTYRALSSAYIELGLFGTAVTLWKPNYHDFIRGDTLTAGEYWLANGGDYEVDTLYRTLQLTVAQTVEIFGLDAVSSATRVLWDKGSYDKKLPVIHAIEPNRDRIPRRLGPEGKRWLSVYWEEDKDAKEGVLSVSGLDRFPATTPRWDGLLSDVYGYGPASRTMPEIRQLQAMDLKMHQMLDIERTPVFVVPTEIANVPNFSLKPHPGEVVHLPGVGPDVRPLYQVKTDIPAFGVAKEEIRRRIQSGFYADLFLAVTRLDRRQITAHEIDVRQEEKLIALGPVLERLHHGLLSPLIGFTMDLMIEASLAGWRTGERAVLKEPPREMNGEELQVDFVSPLAQAQRAVGIGAMERTAAFVGNLAGIYPDVIRKLNFFEMVEEHATRGGVTSRILRSDEEVQAEMADEAKQKTAQQAMQIGMAGVKGAELLSKTAIGGGQNALQALVRP